VRGVCALPGSGALLQIQAVVHDPFSGQGARQGRKAVSAVKRSTGTILGFVVLLLLAHCSGERGYDVDRLIGRRPATDRMVFDYTGAMADVQPSVEAHLQNIRDRYKIEILVVLLPSLEEKYALSGAAVDLFSNWEIGKQMGGRGLLMLMVDDTKSVKLEVGYELEDVFTDLFTGHIEDVQLQPNYAADRLDIGMVALLEEVEARAQLKYQGRYSRASVAQLDARYLSQGAGARHVLEKPAVEEGFRGEIDGDYPAGDTPAEAWQTMIRHWKERARDPDLGVYTAVTRLTYRDYTRMPDVRFDEDYRRYVDRPYEVRQEGDFAVIYFGKKTGWDNSPFFFCRTREGWQFDIVHQRRFVRMGPAPKWGVEFSEHPYMGLLMDTFYYNGQDIPIAGEDLYTVDRDAAWADRILAAEALYGSDRRDMAAAFELGRLYTLVSMSRKAIPLLQSVQRHAPGDARPYKYLAIAYVNAFYQYDKALKALERYVELAPQDIFGLLFRGYIHYRKKAYDRAAVDLEAALLIDPDSCYAHFYLACAYAGRYRKAARLDPRRSGYEERFREHRDRTRGYEAAHPIRVAWLDRFFSD
jgi:hypothetical protein